MGVLAEPFSIVEKAISESVHLQLTRLPDSATSLDWLFGKRCLVAGLGPVGLLAALSLRLRGGEVWGLDVVDAGTPRIYAVTGIPSGDRALTLPGAEFLRRLVLRNQLMVGSVNASRDHFQLAVNDLVRAEARWPQRVVSLITHRHLFQDFESAFQHHGADEIKVVLEWGD